MAIIIILVIIVAELIALGWLAATISTYRKFWVKKALQPGEVTYLALGDSAAQGIGATSPSRGYVGIIGARLEEYSHKKVQIVNLSKTGAKMQDYLSEQSSKAKLVAADLVTIEIGANDVAKFEASKFRSDFRNVLASLPDGSFVANLPLFNSRPTLTAKAKQASEIMQEELKLYPKLHFVDLQKQTSQNQSIFGFAPDLFHPNNLSYKVWADALWDQIKNSEAVVQSIRR